MSPSPRSRAFDGYTISLFASAVISIAISWHSQSLFPHILVGDNILRLLQAALYVLSFAKLVTIANKWVSERSYNNFADDSSWDWSNEMAIVTGGSSGIGAEIVRGLVQHNIRTIILDINMPTSKLGIHHINSCLPQPFSS